MKKGFFIGGILAFGALFMSAVIPDLPYDQAYTVWAESEEYLLPESSSEYIPSGEFLDFSLQELNYARNEIYARHGRMFQSQELTDYFSTKSWYEGTISAESFDTSVLSQIEQSNVDALYEREYTLNEDGYVLDQPGYDISRVRSVSTGGVISDAFREEILSGQIVPIGTECSLDLDGDGTEEEIQLSPNSEGYLDHYWLSNYILQVDGQICTDGGLYVRNQIYGVSLDGHTILLVVYEEGPSDDPECTIFSYVDGKPEKIGEIDDYVSELSIDEKGIIHAKQRTNIIDTSYVNIDWKIDADGMLSEIPQEYYEMHNYSYYTMQDDSYYAYLKAQLELSENIDSDSILIELAPQNVKFPYTDNDSWVYVEGESGNGGWLNVASLSDEDIAQLFDGLRMAD
jgi:hypothetical protein